MADGIQLKAFSVGPMDNNVYILIDPATNESILFDAPTDAQRILRELNGTRVKYILMTHADGDHWQALQEVRERTGAPVGIHPAEADRLPAPPDFELGDNQTYQLGGTDLKAMYTPGHSPGGMSFLLDDILIAGDTLFPGGPGNTQRPDGNFEQIIDSIRSKLFVLPDNTRVYPGHGQPTTIGAEKPHLQEWIDRGW
ncbi:MAG: MBL fold metallo-hydrolase [Chloroflexi bacterium]|nr:MBL fold metallo-hydrolase [Chloroflexota bacterium]